MLKFTKMEGIGNDYIYVDVINQNIHNPQELSKKLSDRHFGIGSDGLILIGKSDQADFKMDIYNSDGSQAEMCGNGIRCAGKFVYDKGYTNKTELTFETLAGIKKLELIIENGKVSLVKVDMGEPILDAKEIPVINDNNEIKDDISFVKVDLPFGKFTVVSMGNPHAICYDFDLKIISRNEINMRVWERGAGETLACGTGACASLVASYLNGYTDRKVIVNLLGGKLEIEYSQENNHVYMIGPARTVFEGEIDLD